MIISYNTRMDKKKIALVLGAGGFIGGAMSKRLAQLGCDVIGADIKEYQFGNPFIKFIKSDLSSEVNMNYLLDFTLKHCKENNLNFSYIFQYAADMGGAGYIFTGANDTNIMLNSSLINLNLIKCLLKLENDTMIKNLTVFYSSSACIYPEFNQLDPDNPNCKENTAYPANPDSEYGWEKIFSERLYLAASRNYGLNVRVARFHNIYGPFGTFEGGKEKAPAAICRKIANAKEGEDVEIWGDGEQTRSFLFIEDCLDATLKFVESDFQGPLNIGSTEMVTINELFEKVKRISRKSIHKRHIDGPLGVRGRNSDNELIEKVLNWKPRYNLEQGLTDTYNWIVNQLGKRND